MGAKKGLGSKGSQGWAKLKHRSCESHQRENGEGGGMTTYRDYRSLKQIEFQLYCRSFGCFWVVVLFHPDREKQNARSPIMEEGGKKRTASRVAWNRAAVSAGTSPQMSGQILGIGGLLTEDKYIPRGGRSGERSKKTIHSQKNIQKEYGIMSQWLKLGGLFILLSKKKEVLAIDDEPHRLLDNSSYRKKGGCRKGRVSSL